MFLCSSVHIRSHHADQQQSTTGTRTFLESIEEQHRSGTHVLCMFSQSDLLDLLDLVCVIVGLVFFSLALLSFALCQWSPGVNNVARINICISLLSAHLLLLLTQQFLSLIRPQQVRMMKELYSSAQPH